MFGIPLGNLIAAGLAFIAVALGTVSLVLVWEVLRGALRRREVKRHLRPFQRVRGTPEARGASLVREDDKVSNAFDSFAVQVSERVGVAGMLKQADLDWGAGTYLGLSLGFAAAGAVMAFVLSGALYAIAAGVALGAISPYLYVSYRRHRYVNRFEEALPESIDLLGRAIRAGHPLSSGIKMVADEGPEPVASEFRTIFEEQRFGLPFDEAMIGLLDRIDLVDVRIFVTAVLVQREVGGNLAEVLDKIAGTIRARFQIRRQLRVYTAQGRLSGYVLAAMPIVVGTGLFLLDPNYMGTLFESVLGRAMLIFAFAMQIFGYLWIRKIVNIDI